MSESPSVPRPAAPCDSVEEVSHTLHGLRFSLLGAGRVGTSMAHWLVARGARAVVVAGRRHGAGLAKDLGAEFRAPQDLESSGQDLLLLTVADGALDAMAQGLSKRPQASVVLHAAGSLDAEVLAPLRRRGSSVGSLHPLLAFPTVRPDLEGLRGAFFAWDGDAAARSLASRLVDAWGGEGRWLRGQDRVLYHLAASWAAGGVVTLLAAGADVAESLGLPPAVRRGYFALAMDALRQAEVAGHPTQAITGPAARGDEATLERHRAALTEAFPDLRPLFDTLTEATQNAVSTRRSSPRRDE